MSKLRLCLGPAYRRASGPFMHLPIVHRLCASRGSPCLAGADEIKKAVGRLASNKRIVRAEYRVDAETYSALLMAKYTDRDVLHTMRDVLNYCLKLGIETYLEGQPVSQEPNK